MKQPGLGIRNELRAPCKLPAVYQSMPGQHVCCTANLHWYYIKQWHIALSIAAVRALHTLSRRRLQGCNLLTTWLMNQTAYLPHA